MASDADSAGARQPQRPGQRPRLRQRLSVLLLRACGFRLVGEPPPLAKCVVVFAPHTSNWDFPLLILTRAAYGVRVHYLAKHTLFQPPFGGFFRWLGGIPVERHRRRGLVGQAVRLLRERPHFWLAMAPEGTRARTDHWRTGFYRIARGADVPLVCVFVDGARRECGVCAVLTLSGDPAKDLEQLRSAYAGRGGLRPERASEVRFRPGAIKSS